MFDVGIWELALVGVIALLVIGPERLPGAARTAGQIVGKIRRSVSSLQAELEKEIDQVKIEAPKGIDDLEKMLSSDQSADARKQQESDKL